jgi:trimeric autotransporter adhesin
MSTKTIYKRIALVAVAALGAGVLSVAPASAAAGATTLTFTNTTSATTTPVVGSPVQLPISVALSGTADTAATGTLEARITTKPTNTALTEFSTSVTNSAHAAALTTAKVTAVAPTVATASAGAILNLAAAADAATVAANAAGVFSFTPDVAGYYEITFTKGGTATTAFTANVVGINVSGAALVQSNTGLGAATGAQIAGRQSAAAFFLPAGSTTASRYTVTATGATIVSVKSGSSKADAVNANTYTSSTGVTTIAPTDFSLGARIAGAATTTGVAVTGSSITDSVIVQFTSATSGSAVVTLRSENVTTGALTTVATATVTYGSADLLALSVSNTTIHKAKSNDAPSASTDVTAIVQSAVVGTQRANILVTVKNGNDTALVDQNVTATISGPGLIAWDSDGSGNGTSAGSVVMDMGANENDEYLVVSGSGVGGVATITFAIGTTVLGTETITFYGAVAKYTATTNIVAAANGTTSTDVVTVCATDAANVAVPGATIYGYSGDTTVATMAETSDETEATAIATSGTSMANHVAATAVGCVGFSITGLTQLTKPSVVLTFGNAATIATSTITTTATVLVGSVAATTVALTADKATYAPGAAVVLSLTYKDSVGRPVAYGPGTGTLAAALTGSSALGTAALFGTDNISKLGSTTQTVFAPLSAGPVTVSGLTGAGSTGTYLVTAAQGVAVSATFTVSQNADISAITTLINSLIAKINALNKLVIKIQKKVRA